VTRFLPLSLLVPFVACTPADTPAAAPVWETGGDANVCAALQHQEAATIMLSISRLPNMSGINVVTDSLSFAREGRFEPDVRVSVEGRDVPATVIGVSVAGAPGLLFRLDPLPLIERYPDGFRFRITRTGTQLADLALRGASRAFRELRACADGRAANE